MELSGAAKAVLAGMTTLMVWPLSNGLADVHAAEHCAAFGTMSPLFTVAPAVATSPSVTTAATSSPMPALCNRVQ